MSEPHTSRHVVLASGFSLNTILWGQGPAMLVLLHGLGDCGLTWRRFAEATATRGARLALDLPGHGESDWYSDGRYEVGRIAADVAEALERIGSRRLVLIGHSLGAHVAMALAAQKPAALAAVVLIEGAPFINPAAASAMGRALDSLPTTFPSQAEHLAMLKSYLPMVDGDILEELAPAMAHRREDGSVQRRMDPALARNITFSLDDELVAQLESISCSVLIVRGAWSSALSRRAVQQAMSRCQHGQMCEVPGAGHAVTLENAPALAASVGAFLDSVVPS